MLIICGVIKTDCPWLKFDFKSLFAVLWFAYFVFFNQFKTSKDQFCFVLQNNNLLNVSIF